MLEDKSYITINYQHIYEIKLRNYLNLTSKYYDFVTKLYHTTYSKLDFKYGYFPIKLHLEDRYILIFTILEIIQVQLI